MSAGPACADLEPDEADDLFYAHNTHRAVAFCLDCPARRECLDRALEAERGLGVSARWGVIGGLRPDQRARLEKATG